MLKRIIILISLALILQLILPTLFIRKITTYSVDSSEQIIEILPGNEYKIEIIPSSKKVSYSEILFKNPNLANTEKFYVSVDNIKNNIELSSFNVGDPSWLRFDSNVNLGSDEKYSLTIKNPSSNKNKILLLSDVQARPSIRVISKLTIAESLNNTIKTRIEWTKQTSHAHLLLYFLILAICCIL